MLKEILTPANSTSDKIREILVFLVNILITAFIIRFAWNRSLVPHITILKPLETLLDALVISLSISVFRDF